MPMLLSALALLLPAATATAGTAEPDGEVRMRVRIERRVVIRMPRAPAVQTAGSSRPLPPIRWEERRAGRCVALRQLAGAAITRPDSVDLLLAGGKRARAHTASEASAR